MCANEPVGCELSTLNEDLRRAIEDLHLVIQANQGEHVDEILLHAELFARSMWLSAMTLMGVWEKAFEFSGHDWRVRFHGFSCAALVCREIMERYLVFRWIYNGRGVSEKTICSGELPLGQLGLDWLW